MIPLLYKKDGATKIGELTNCIECLVEEERNGIFEVSIIYPTTDSIFNSLEEENIIICDANDTLKAQKFRIYMTRKLMSNKIEVYARHISFDLAYDTVDNIDITNQSCEYVLNTIFRQSQFSTHYKGYSDIVNAQNYKMSMANCIEAIAGKEGSIIDTFGTGAEILRDNINISVLNKRGHDNDVTIEYAKNLTGFELEEDYSELVTRINAYAKYTNSETNKEVLVEAKGVDSPLITNYSHPYVAYIDYSDKFENEEIPTKEKLIELAKKEYSINNKDKPKQNYKIEFVPLSKCVGYEGLEDKISLCDTVTIKDTRYGIDTKSKVIRTVFDVLKNRYDSMELGEPRTTLGDIIGGSGEDGEVGPPGPQGPPGADGNIGDFPNSLPSVPVLSSKVYGFANIELSWTYENKVYYNYELYASKTKDFTPNVFDIIHQGQTSSFLFQAKPNETWYFRACAVNTHGNRTEFSSQIAVTTKKIDDLSNYVDNMAINDALIGTLSLDRGWVGQLRGHWIDAKNLSVTDGNGKRTLDIDSFGNVNIAATNISMIVDGQDQGIVSQSEFNQTKDRIDMQVKYAGNGNLVPLGKPNSSNWFKGWTIDENTQVYWSSSTNFAFMKKSVGQGSANLKTIVIPVKQNTHYSFQCDIAKESNVSSCVINIHCQNKEFSDIAMYKAIETSYTGEQHIQYTFETPIDCEYIYIEFVYWHRNGEKNSVIWVDNVQMNLGESFYPAYSPNIENIHNAVVSVFNEGIEIRQEDGSKAIYTGYKIAFTDTNGNDGLRIVDGGLVFNDQTTGEYMGFIHSTTRKDIEENINGITIASPLNGDYINFCDTNSMDPYDFVTGLRDYMTIWTAKNTFNDTFPSNGIYMLKELICRDNVHVDGDMYIKAEAEFSRKVKFKAGLTTDGDITIPQGCSLDLQGGNFLNTSQYGQAILCGSQILRLCNRVNNGYVKEMLVIANGYGVECYGVLNMHGNAIINAASVYDLNVANKNIDSVLDDLSKEDFAEIVEDDKLKVDLAEFNKVLYSRNKALEKENEKLIKQQLEQDEMIIENAFAIANIELGGL